MQFQALHLLSQTHPPPRQDRNQNSLTAIHSSFGKKRNAEGAIVDHQPTSSVTHQTLVTAVGSRSVARAVAKAKTIDIAVAEIAKSMPEAYDGEHPETLRAMTSGSDREAQMAAFKMLVYQVSNNLVESELEEDTADDDQYKRIVDSFREIGLPRESWVETFTKQQDRSSRAFAEKLFEAAVNSEDLALMEALLDSGISPDQPVMTNMNGWHERPIQLSADNRVQNLDMAALLVKAGAKVDAITEANYQPAVHIAADAARPDIVRLLVGSGADIYRDARDPVYADEPA